VYVKNEKKNRWFCLLIIKCEHVERIKGADDDDENVVTKKKRQKKYLRLETSGQSQDFCVWIVELQKLCQSARTKIRTRT